MRKTLLTLNAYPNGHFMSELFNSTIKPNFQKYCDLHGFELIVISQKTHSLHIHWSKIIWILDNWKSFNEGDVITYIDSDSLILNFDHEFIFEKNFAVPVESTGLLCMGFFSIKVCDWTAAFLTKMLSLEPQCNKFFNDNHALYLAMGQSFGAIHLTKVLEEIQVLPINYNVTILPEELKNSEDPTAATLIKCYLPEMAIPFEEIIIRHFAAGQIYKPFFKNYIGK